MASRDQVRMRLGSERDYAAAADELAIPPGQAYLIATGIPADGSDADPSRDASVALEGSTQHLVYRAAGAHNPAANETVHRWLKDRVARDRAMRAAAETRDAAPGEPRQTDEDDISSVITRDHDQVSALLKLIKTIPGKKAGGSAKHLSERESVLDMITVALSKHEATEEEHLWPVVRSVLTDGDALAETALQQEQEGKDLLTKMERLAPDDDELDELIEKLDTLAHRHVAFEDRVLLKLREALDENEQKSLGAKFRRAEGRAPTRPHRHAPSHPGAAVKVAGAAGAALDHVRDAVGSRPAERRGKPSGQAEDEALQEAIEQEKEEQ